MRNIFLVYSICMFCNEISASHRFDFKGGDGKQIKRNISRFIYSVHAFKTSKINSNLNYSRKANASDEGSTTSADICNVTPANESSSQQRKRSIHYFNEQFVTEIPDTEDFTILSDNFLDCDAYINVEPNCFQMFVNESVYVPRYQRLFEKSNYVINQGELIVCPDFFEVQEEKFSSNIDETISTVGISISTACILLHMIMFFIVEKLRNLPGYCLFSLCVSLLMAYTNSFIQMSIHERVDCKVIGMITVYSLLSSFFWMNVIAFDVCYAIRLATSKLRLNTNRSMLFRFSVYSCYAWGMPFMIIITALIVDSLTEDKEYQLIFRPTTCWFQYRTANLLYFALPLFILLVMNLIFFIASFVMILESRSGSGSQDAHNLRSRLFMALRLGSAMGLMWIFGVIATVTQKEWISYLYSVCVAMQGVFIFFSFTLNKKTTSAVKSFMGKKKISMFSSQSRF